MKRYAKDVLDIASHLLGLVFVICGIILLLCEHPDISRQISALMKGIGSLAAGALMIFAAEVFCD